MQGSRVLATGVAIVVLVLATGMLDAVPLEAEAAKPAPRCAGSEGKVTFSVSSSRSLGETKTLLPAEANAITVVVTVPANKTDQAAACAVGDEGVDVGTCPEEGECAGFSIRAENDTGLDRCHAADQTLGPYDWPLPKGGVVKLLFNALTEKTSIAQVELTCNRAGPKEP